MSSFGSRRKARVINVDDEEVQTAENNDSENGGAPTTDLSQPSFKIKSTKKGIRQSGLRKTFTADGASDNAVPANEEEDDGPVVVKAKFGTQKQRKKPNSRLSFGLEGVEVEKDDATLEVPMKKSTLGQRVVENNAVKRGIAMRGFPVRNLDDDDDRPRYSKEYLEELQSSTPTTPMDSASLPTDGDEMELDASELEGAMIVDSPSPAPPATKIQVLTASEIQERKERRARLAQEQDFLSLDDDNDDGRAKKKGDTRLATDEDQMGGGFDDFVDDFVDDGGVSLGKRAEKQRRRLDRQKMAELIDAAEGRSSDSSSDSEAERRIAYEAAQTRSGLDGLRKARPRRDLARELLEIPPKITPLPGLAACVARLQATLAGMEAQIGAKAAEVAGMRAEREGIAAREAEVQALLDETGRKYQEAMGRTPARVMGEGMPAGDLGPESLGSTPSRATADAGGAEL